MRERNDIRNGILHLFTGTTGAIALSASHGLFNARIGEAIDQLPSPVCGPHEPVVARSVEGGVKSTW